MNTTPNEPSIPVPTVRVNVAVSAEGQPLGGFSAQLYWINTADGGNTPASQDVPADPHTNPPCVILRPTIEPPPHWALRLYLTLMGNPWAIRSVLELGHVTHDRDVHFVLVRNGA